MGSLLRASRRSRRTLPPPTRQAHGRHRRPRSVDLALPTLPVRRPELELLELPGGGAGELVAELHAGRALVVREVGPAVLDDLLLRRRRAGNEHHEALDRLAPLLVGHA